MFFRLCALALATAPLHHVAQIQEVRPEPQGLWSLAVRDRSLLVEGAADEARELGSRALNELPSGAQSSLRLMRLRQTDLRARVREPLRAAGTEAEFESRAKQLTTAGSADVDRATRAALRLSEGDVDLEEKAAAEIERELQELRPRLERARTDLAARERSYLCGLGTMVCRFVTTSALRQRDREESDGRALEGRAAEAARRVTEARGRRDTLRANADAYAANYVERAKALEGFYRTTSSANCPRRLAFHQAPNVGLRESPMLRGSISEEDIVRDRTSLFACVDDRNLLTGVEITDDQGRRLAKSEITRDRAGGISRVRIFDRTSSLVEDHRWSPVTPEYEVVYRGARGGRVRASTK